MENILEISTANHIIYPVEGFIWSNRYKKYLTAKDSHGYLQVKINGRTDRHHRIIYEAFHGLKLKPEENINHINHKKDDNRISNLEIVTTTQNNQWIRTPKSNTSGYKGVSKRRNKWRAFISINTKQCHLGYFDSREEASAVYVAKCRELNSQGHKYFIPEM